MLNVIISYQKYEKIDLMIKYYHIKIGGIMLFYEMTNNQILKEIGKRIRRKRLNKNMSQEDIAVKAGLSRRTISLVESNGCVGFKVIICILRVLKNLEDLDLLFPEESLSPIQLLKLKGSIRKRASSPRSKKG